MYTIANTLFYTYSDKVCMYNCKKYNYKYLSNQNFVKVNLKSFFFTDVYTCPVCLDNIDNNSSVIVDTLCGHYICSKCWNNSYVDLTKYNKYVYIHCLSGICTKCSVDTKLKNYPIYFYNNEAYCIQCAIQYDIFTDNTINYFCCMKW